MTVHCAWFFVIGLEFSAIGDSGYEATEPHVNTDRQSAGMHILVAIKPIKLSKVLSSKMNRLGLPVFNDARKVKTMNGMINY